ncbi:sigma-70 family RNA polymerase sigma factor [Flavobacterium dauae]|uniref:sigma-70 family RNA polymerase sigma factor n=1 Tax=Flavobacterium dauae TaxID=1563479 RepID=UPI001A93421B|nr:sigma-70 family RNA polymerase sigma factor [Flavobacterium dauae]WLD25031.1 sigma-70 family RNA polymerase sigma factor [Flavobacterium dauae]
MTELEVIKRVLNGEKKLYEIIVRRFNPYLYKVGRAYNYNHEDTQDLMQETFIDAYKSLIQFEGRANFKTWIVRIMLNNCYRKKEKLSFKNEIMQDVNDDSKPLFANTNNDTGKIIQNRELAHIIEDALGKIPLDYQMTFSLREINGMNVSETANLLNISEANVKTRLNRAKTMLRNEIEKKYSAQELFEFNLIYCDIIVENVMKKINEL